MLKQQGAAPGSIMGFDSQSELLAQAGWDGQVRVWRLPAAAEVARWQAQRDIITGLAFVEHDRHVLTSALDGSVAEWGLNGASVRRAQSPSAVLRMRVDEPRDLVITGHRDGAVRLWRLRDLSLVGEFYLHRGKVLGLAWHPGSGRGASSGTDRRVFLWSLDGVPEELPAPPTDARTLEFGTGGGVLYGGGWFRLFRWSLPSPACVSHYRSTATAPWHALPGLRSVGALNIVSTPPARYSVAKARQPTPLNRLATNGGEKCSLGLRTFPTRHHGIITALRYDPRSHRLASISRIADSAVFFLDPDNGQALQRFQAHQLCGSDVQLSPDGRYLATTGEDAAVQIWDLARISHPIRVPSLGP